MSPDLSNPSQHRILFPFFLSSTPFFLPPLPRFSPPFLNGTLSSEYMTLDLRPSHEPLVLDQPRADIIRLCSPVHIWKWSFLSTHCRFSLQLLKIGVILLRLCQHLVWVLPFVLLIFNRFWSLQFIAGILYCSDAHKRSSLQRK